MQTKRQSLIETVTNTSIGMAGSWVITLSTITLVEDKLIASILTVAGCTVWSLLRGYAVRRYFNSKVSV